MVDWLVYNGFAPTRGDLAKLLGYNPTVLSAALTGRIPFSSKMAARLCHKFERLNYEWLMEEKGEMILPEGGKSALSATSAGKNTAPHGETDRQSAAQQRSNAATHSAGKRRTVVPSVPEVSDIERNMSPFYSDLRVSAGQTEFFDASTSTDKIYIPGVHAEAFFPVVGMSIEPHIHPGDIIGVRTVDSLERIDPSRIYMIVTHQNERMIKHILPSKPEDEEITLTSDNPDYPPFSILKSSIHRVMRVVYVGREV